MDLLDRGQPVMVKDDRETLFSDPFLRACVSARLHALGEVSEEGHP